MLNRFSSVAAVIGLAFVTACGDDDSSGTVGSNNNNQSLSIVETARAAGSFTTLIGALEATGLDATLAGPGPWTVMAPTDDAFARLPAGVVASLDAATLTKILTYHVVPDEAEAATVVTLDEAPTVEGQPLAIAVRGGGVILNGTVQVTDTDIFANNGVIHVIDSILLPPDIDFPGTVVEAAQAYPIFDTLVGAVVGAGLAGDLSTDNNGDGFTVFAPTNAAFVALGADLSMLTQQELANILLYHVVGGTVDASTVVSLTSAATLQGGSVGIDVSSAGVRLDNVADVTWVDVRASNGILHVIDGVLLP